MRWVSESIEPHTKTYDETKMQEFFYPHDAEAVLEIKLTHGPREGFATWNMEDNDLFTF
jgi:hypothetical protein